MMRPDAVSSAAPTRKPENGAWALSRAARAASSKRVSRDCGGVFASIDGPLRRIPKIQKLGPVPALHNRRSFSEIVHQLAGCRKPHEENLRLLDCRPVPGFLGDF